MSGKYDLSGIGIAQDRTRGTFLCQYVDDTHIAALSFKQFIFQICLQPSQFII